MVQVRIKRVYEDFSETDGYRVLVPFYGAGL